MEDNDEQPDLPVALARPRRHNANQIDRFVPNVDDRNQPSRGRQRQQRRGNVDRLGHVPVRQPPRHRGGDSSQVPPQPHEIPNHPEWFIALCPHLQEIWIDPFFIRRDHQNSQRDPTVGQESDMGGMWASMTPISKLTRMALENAPDRNNPSHQEYFRKVGLPLPVLDQPFEISQDVRFVWMTDAESLSALGTSPNSMFSREIPITQDDVFFFGLDDEYEEDNTDDVAHLHINDTSRPGKWVLRISNTIEVQRQCYFPTRARNNPGMAGIWSKVYCQYETSQNGTGPGARFIKKIPAQLISTGGDDTRYDPAHPTRMCRPDNTVVYYLYHPKLFPGANSRRFIRSAYRNN